ncbi:MAG: SDR family oxidoreductase [Alphaproteobacteria bacterium]|jgi:NAD(P)-dependent dehydrogenase (short-subunit alcohol dehydrogenase family)|nr:SDR family oxidoreductase [Alphaproteobacteria bacterium]
MKLNTLFKQLLFVNYILVLGALFHLSPLVAQEKSKVSKADLVQKAEPTKDFKNDVTPPNSGNTSSKRFQDKVVFITGGTTGIGLATAVKFAAEGASHVIVCGRNKSKWLGSQDYIKGHLTEEQAKTIEFVPCDVRVESKVKETIQNIYEKYGRLDICFNNAGVQPGDASVGGNVTELEFDSLIGEDGSIVYRLPPPQPTSPCQENQTCKSPNPSQTTKASSYSESPLATSIFGVFYCLKWEIAFAFSKQPKDMPMAIINTSSRNGIIPDPHRPLYAGAKAFVISITKSLSNQVAQRAIKEKRAPIRINVIAPGPVDTPLERAAFPGSDAEFTAKASVGVPMERVAQPEEIASVVLFLADGNQSGYITGANLPVDGGDVASPLMRVP